MGEALNQLSRNILVHAYREVDDGIVWQVATEKLPGLLENLRGLLAELDP